jgi:hypothetical protein
MAMLTALLQEQSLKALLALLLLLLLLLLTLTAAVGNC